jgi:hypothetical protein
VYMGLILFWPEYWAIASARFSSRAAREPARVGSFRAKY